VLVLTNSTTSRKVLLQLNEWVADLTVPTDSLVTLTWK
jgi:hypothetical protein